MKKLAAGLVIAGVLCISGAAFAVAGTSQTRRQPPSFQRGNRPPVSMDKPPMPPDGKHPPMSRDKRPPMHLRSGDKRPPMPPRSGDRRPSKFNSK